jgi:hypothetical protein
MAVIDYDVIDTAKAIELSNDPDAAERFLQAFAEQLIVNMQADGLPANVEVSTLAESESDDTLRGIAVTDYDHSIAYRCVLVDGDVRLNSVCLLHKGACVCPAWLLASGLCRVLQVAEPLLRRNIRNAPPNNSQGDA